MVLQRLLQNGKYGHSAMRSPSIFVSQIGHRTLIIGRLRFRLGLFPPAVPAFFAACAADRIGFTSRAVGLRRLRLGGLRRLLLCLRGLLVRLAAIIRFVEPATLEDDRGAGTQQTAQLFLLALRALL